jgi:hypothetical protein
MDVFSNPMVQFISVVLLIISAALIGYFTTKKEGMAAVGSEQEAVVVEEEEKQDVKAFEDKALAPVELPESEEALKPEELLPKSDDVSKWESQFPVGAGEAKDKNFLVAGYNIGINTVSSSLKNANLQLRSDPYIPRVDTGPWNQSTIMSSDLTNRKTFEIGSSA